MGNQRSVSDTHCSLLDEAGFKYSYEYQRCSTEMDVSKRSLFATYPHTGRVTAVQYFNEYILTVGVECGPCQTYHNPTTDLEHWLTRPLRARPTGGCKRGTVNWSITTALGHRLRATNWGSARWHACTPMPRGWRTEARTRQFQFGTSRHSRAKTRRCCSRVEFSLLTSAWYRIQFQWWLFYV